MSPLMNHFVRRAVPGALSVGALTAVLAGCGDTTTLTSLSADRIVPTVSLAVEGVRNAPPKVDSVNIRSPLTVTVNATDNAAIQAIVTSIVVDGAVLKADSVATTTGSNTVSRTSKVQLSGIRPGQAIIIRATAIDAGGNKGSAEVGAVAFDPAIPRVAMLNPDGAVIAGGTYTLNVQGVDTLGISKIGYRSSGPSALTRSDSTLFSVPYPKNDTVTFSFTVPSPLALAPRSPSRRSRRIAMGCRAPVKRSRCALPPRALTRKRRSRIRASRRVSRRAIRSTSPVAIRMAWSRRSATL